MGRAGLSMSDLPYFPRAGTYRCFTYPDSMPHIRSISPLTLLASVCVAFLFGCATAPETQPDIKVLAEGNEPAAAAMPASGASAATARPAAARPAAAPSGPQLPPLATL